MSLRYGEPAMGLVLDRASATLALSGSALALSIIIAVPLGILAAAFRGTVLDSISLVISLVGQPPGLHAGRAGNVAQRLHTLDSHALLARDAFSMTAHEGAKVLGWDDEIGRLAPGFQADLVMLDLRHPVAGPQLPLSQRA
ncbi:amidohydrolase family protein [Puniceibacterium sp. IMCC21224]|uniref:amidohydrolase family protein n=1 Tax=Puniceibacterium sp. IMCC21224 TaxID=1618204 RepID=UPI00064DDD4B|nr:amidohydrolase family protein [Puniceibacterium sp. IMCC21224]KMK64800.1 Amidohydrolase family [Puniceibacterium sp. IMCC21224]